MQRSSNSSSRSGDDQRTITIGTEQQQQNAKRRRNTDDDTLDGLPLYNLRTAAGRKDFSRPRSPPVGKWIHAIPILVLLCLFTLWCFSFRVDVEIKDGRIATIREIIPSIPNDTRIDLTILAVAALSPIPSIHQDLSNHDEMNLAPASSPN